MRDAHSLCLVCIMMFCLCRVGNCNPASSGDLEIDYLFGLGVHAKRGDAEVVSNFALPAIAFLHHQGSPGSPKDECYGTGFFINSQGDVLTCSHVVNPQNSKTPTGSTWARLRDGRTCKTTVRYTFPDLDIAILKTDVRTVEYLSIDTKSWPQQGAEAYVIGFPAGEILSKEPSVTHGIVSAVRDDRAVLQIDAAVNPGNSGGPVLNSSGQVVGVAWAKLPRYDGINFAVSGTAISKELGSSLALDDERRVPMSASRVARAVVSGDSDALDDATPRPSWCKERYEDGKTPLMIATMLKRTDMMRSLIAKGQDVNAVDAHGNTALHSYSDSPPQGDRRCTDYEVASLLLAAGANVRAANVLGNTALHFSTNDARAVELFTGKGLDVNSRNKAGETPLMSACWVNSEDALVFVGALIQAGADVRAQDLRGNTPLHHSLDQGLPGTSKAVSFLLSKGANANATNKHGETPLHVWARRSILGYRFWTSFPSMGEDTLKEEADRIVSLLVTKGAEINAKDHSGSTPLHTAASSGNTIAAEALRKYGARE